MDPIVAGLVLVLVAVASLLLLAASYTLGKDAGVRHERGEWVALLLIAWVAVREKRRE